jgi:methionyl-tRNA formyltransferase
VLKVLFLGSGGFAVPILSALALDEGISVECVISRPDAAAGRGRASRPCPVAVLARELGLPLLTPPRLDGAARESLGAFSPDVAVSADYGLWLPRWMLALPACGVVNVHPSLLPRFRGPAPVQHCIISGDAVTGVSFMLTDSGWDTGPVIGVLEQPVMAGDTAGSLEARLSSAASERLAGLLRRYAEGCIEPVPQSGTPVHAPVLEPSATWLDWCMPAASVDRLIRALSPAPTARTLFRGRTLLVHKASPRESGGLAPGVISVEGSRIFAGCSPGLVEFLEVQPESRKRMTAGAFVAGYRPSSGEALAAP